jgi:protein-disulfide isomerase/uncharacterized membrane protein
LSANETEQDAVTTGAEDRGPGGVVPAAPGGTREGVASGRIVAALLLCLAAAAVSGLLLLQHHGEGAAVTAVNEACGDGQTSGCEEVARSSWSKVGGMPLAGLGLAFYLTVAIGLALALLGPLALRPPIAAVAAAALGLALGVDLVLLGVQAFALRAFCLLCLATYVLGGAALVLLWPAWRSARGAEAVGAGADGRLALGAWAIGAVLVATSVAAANSTLAYRAQRRQAQLLGAPGPASPAAPAAADSGSAAEASPPEAAPAPPPLLATAPAVAASPAAEPGATDWQARARELQATLDDPRKLEAYFTEKARREYETAAVAAIDLASAPAKGPAGAPVKVVEYSDFLCPFCRNLAVALSQFVPQAGGRVAVYFKNYPLDAACNPKLRQSTHPGACALAMGAVCAHRQGKFEAYHDKVFSAELRQPQPADVVRLAGEAGLNGAAMQACLDDPTTREALDAEIAEANRLGIAATPTLYVNGKRLPRINDFVAVVDQEARKKGFAPLAAGQ